MRRYQESNLASRTGAAVVAARMQRLPERFFGDGPPHWLQSRNNLPAETAAQAERARDKIVPRLRKQAKIETASDRQNRLEIIAEAIEGCRPGGRCRNYACPICMRAHQRWFVWTAPVALRRVFGADTALAALSIVPTIRLVSGSSLTQIREQVTRLMTKLTTGIEGSEVTFLIGGIDISANIDAASSRAKPSRERDRNEATRFQLHLLAIGREANIRAAAPALRQAFQATRQVRRPVMIKAFNGLSKGYAYALKSHFNQRVGTRDNPETSDAGSLQNSQDGATATKRRNTRGKRLTVAQHAVMTILLNILGERRLLLLGAEVTEGKKGSPVIRRSKKVSA